MGATFYLASTPYHVLLALADAERARAQATLFFFGAFPSAAQYLAALLETPALLPGLHVDGIIGSAKARALRREARQRLRDCMELCSPDRVVVFNDRHDLSQLVLAIAAAGKGVTRACFEDGSSFYTGWLAPAAGFWTQLRKRLFTAPRWTPIRILGTHPLVDEVRALRPDAVRPELRGRAQALELDLLASPVLRRFSERLLHAMRSAGQTPELPPCPDLLLTPPLEKVEAWAARAREVLGESPGVAIKYHPRQAEIDPGNLLRFGPEISRHLPLELLYLLWGRAPRCVVGDGNSTTLLSTRLLAPDARVIGLCLRGRPEHTETYARLGIELRFDAAQT